MEDSKKPSRALCATCQKPTELFCGFELYGKQAGKLCSRPVCASHSGRSATGELFCQPHLRFKKPELSLPAAAPSVPSVVETPPQPDIVSDKIEFIHAVVGDMLEFSDRRRIDYRAAFVMLAPMIPSAGFDADSISRVTGWNAAQIATITANLTGAGIWQERKWNCDWGILFSGKDDFTDAELFAIQVSFVSDSLVAAGKAVRVEKNGEFYYKKKEDEPVPPPPSSRDIIRQMVSTYERREHA